MDKRIEQLEALFNRTEVEWSGDYEIEILPNGEIRRKGGSEGEDLGGKKPLTFKENLGGEYAFL